MVLTSSVILKSIQNPANKFVSIANITDSLTLNMKYWIPACAGMTVPENPVWVLSLWILNGNCGMGNANFAGILEYMILIILCFIILPFAFVLLFGAPYLPTRKEQARHALDMLTLKEGDVFVDLGSGDGAVLIEAASRGLVCYGYELNPLVWLVAKFRTRRFGSQVTIYCKNFWAAQLPEETKGVFVFLLAKYMTKLNAKLSAELRRGTPVVSYTFQVPNKKPERQERAMYLYRY